MSGRPRKEEEEKGFLGSLAGGLLLAGGAAAVGYMAYKMFEGENSCDTSCSTSGLGSRPVDSFNRSSRKTNDTKTRMENRKKESMSNCKVDNPQGSKCIICYENEREMLFEPCNHVCACEDCAGKLTTPRCPVCREQIVSKKHVFL